MFTNLGNQWIVVIAPLDLIDSRPERLPRHIGEDIAKDHKTPVNGDEILYSWSTGYAAGEPRADDAAVTAGGGKLECPGRRPARSAQVEPCSHSHESRRPASRSSAECWPGRRSRWL